MVLFDVPKVLIFALAICSVYAFEDGGCRPRLVLKSTVTDSDNVVNPRFKTVYECSGADNHSLPTWRCAAIEEEEITVFVTLVNFTTRTDTTIKRKLMNHTKCEMKCFCRCDKKVTDQRDSTECEPEFSWDATKCKCVPKCGAKIDRGTGPAVDNSKGVAVSTFVVALIVELVIVLIVVFIIMDTCKCVKDSKGVIYTTTQYVRQLSNGEKDGYKTTDTIEKGERDTGSVSCLHDINNPNTRKTRV